MPDGQRIVELVGGKHEKEDGFALCEKVNKGLAAGYKPELQKEGMGGAYLLRDEEGTAMAVYKPLDEEAFAPNNPKGFVGKNMGDEGAGGSIRVGEAALREVAVSLLDGGFAGVPTTVLARMGKAGERRSSWKLGSLQAFVPHEADCGEIGASVLPAKEVHRVGLLDVLAFNIDRHGGNILVNGLGLGGRVHDSPSSGPVVKPIDHGNCLPEALEPPYLEWLHWRQASIPFGEEERGWVKGLSYESMVSMLKAEVPGLRLGCSRVLWVTIALLREAVLSHSLTLAHLGSVVSRPISGVSEANSPLEIACYRAIVDSRHASHPHSPPRSLGSPEPDDSLQFTLEEEEETVSPLPASPTTLCHVPNSPPRQSSSSFTGGTFFHTPAPDGDGSDLIRVSLESLSEVEWRAFQENFLRHHLPSALEPLQPDASVLGSSCPTTWHHW